MLVHNFLSCSHNDEKLNLPFDAPFIEALQEDVEQAAGVKYCPSAWG